MAYLTMPLSYIRPLPSLGPKYFPQHPIATYPQPRFFRWGEWTCFNLIQKGKVVPVNAMGAVAETDIQFHSFIVSGLDRGENSSSSLDPRERTRYPLKSDGVWATDVVWTYWRRENSRSPIRIGTQDRPARTLIVLLTSQLLTLVNKVIGLVI